MKQISKRFNTLWAAEQYQDKLYEEYDHVLLLMAPMFEEAGLYIWQVRE